MKILVVDDHGLFRAGLRLLVVSVKQEAQVFEAATLSEAIAVAQRMPDLDLCLLDLGLNGVQGIETLTSFKSAVPDLAVVVVSAAHDTTTIRRCLDAGAMSFVPKAMSPQTLTLALQQVLAGFVYLPPEAMHIAPTVPAAPSLSPRQLDVLRGLARGLPTKSIARELNLSEHTAKEYIASVFQALGVHNRTHAVIIGTRLGLSAAMPAQPQ